MIKPVAAMENTVINVAGPYSMPNAIPGFSVKVNRNQSPTRLIDSCRFIVLRTAILDA